MPEDTQETWKKKMQRQEDLRSVESRLIASVDSLYNQANQANQANKAFYKGFAGMDGWRYYIHPFIREKLHSAIIAYYRANGMPFYEVACKPALDTYRGIKIVEGYEYGIVLAHERCIFYPENDLVFKDIFITRTPEPVL